jgi:hypothetical protein
MAPRGLLLGGLAAILAFPAALLGATLGQGLGALLGGCGWIGASTPIHRQVWALVNQPALNFASLPRGLGYWLGSLALPLLISYGLVHLLPRGRSLAAELVVLHVAWGSTTVAVAWLPLLDLADGHLHRALELWRLPTELAWIAPALAAPAALPPTIRLLALLRTTRQHTGRWRRLAAVAAHLVLPVGVWVVLASWLRGQAPLSSVIGVLVPTLTCLTVAWHGYPSPFPHRLRELRSVDAIRLAVAAAVVVSAVVFAGRPLDGERVAGALWANPKSYNNIRPWITPSPMLPGVGTAVPSAPGEPSI